MNQTPIARAAQQIAGSIIKPYTLDEIGTKLLAGDYSAELMLQHLLRHMNTQPKQIPPAGFVAEDETAPQSAVEWVSDRQVRAGFAGADQYVVPMEHALDLARRCEEAERALRHHNDQLADEQNQFGLMKGKLHSLKTQLAAAQAENERLRKGITEIKAGTRIGWFMTDLGAKCEKLLNP